MTKDFAFVRDSLAIDMLAKGLLERGVSCAAVADAHGIVVGYVSMVDLVRERYLNAETGAALRTYGKRERVGRGFHVDGQPTATVRDIMMPFVLRVSETATIDEVASMMASEGVHHLLVVSALGNVVGIVGALDVLRWMAERDGCAVARRATWRRACEYAT